jgi:Tol biopolymer transport system component/DNA-binding winged helix-turn-helix (wHTH) protein
MPTLAPHVVRVADFSLDTRTGELSQNGQRQQLPEQMFLVLAALARQPGDLVTREEIATMLWGNDVNVDFDGGINAVIRRLRDVLGDSAIAPRFIETLPRRGYRFIAPIEPAMLPSITPADAPAAISTVAPGRSRPWLIVLAGAVVLAVAVASWRRMPQGPVAELTRLTSTSGLNTDPTLSPDGAFAAYASDRAGKGSLDIWVQPVAGGDPIQLTDNPDDEAEPAFSPDGAKVVFANRFSERNAPGVYVIDARGGDARLIDQAQSARNPRFSPANEAVAYWTGFPPSIVAGGIPGALGKIFVVSVDGISRHAIAPELASARYPVWAPDGQHILFLGEGDAGEQTMDWYVARRDGTEAVKTGALDALAAAGITRTVPIPAAWTASGDVLFATNQSASSNVWMVPVALATGLVAGTPHRLTFGTASERSPSISASGRIAFTSVAENVDVWRVPLDSRTGLATGAAERVTDDVDADKLRNITSDGHLLTFLSPRTKRDEVWVKDLTTGRERQLTYDGATDTSMSPDGTELAFAAGEPGARHVEVLETGEGVRRTLCQDCDFTWGWSADSSHVLLGKGRPARLLLFDVSSGRQTEVTSHSSWGLFQAQFSPNGEWMAFHTTNSPSSRQIYAAHVSDGVPVQSQRWVPIVTDHGCHPNWSADGSMIYHFSVRDHAGFCPWVQRVDPRTARPIDAPRPLLHLHNPRLRAASGAAATNAVRGGYFYLTATETTGNIWILDQR